MPFKKTGSSASFVTITNESDSRQQSYENLPATGLNTPSLGDQQGTHVTEKQNPGTKFLHHQGISFM